MPQPHIIKPDPEDVKRLCRQFAYWNPLVGTEVDAYIYQNNVIVPAIECNKKFVYLIESDVEIPTTSNKLFFNQNELSNWVFAVQKIGEFLYEKPVQRKTLQDSPRRNRLS